MASVDAAEDAPTVYIFFAAGGNVRLFTTDAKQAQRFAADNDQQPVVYRPIPPVEPVKEADVSDAEIIRGMVALTHIGWAPELRYDDDGHWKIQADTFCDEPWHESPLEAWQHFVAVRLKDEPEAIAAIRALRGGTP